MAFLTLAAFNAGFSCLFIALTIPGIITDVIFTGKAENLRRKLAPDVRKFSYYRWMLTDEWPAQDVRMYDLTIPIKNRYDTEKDIYIRANKALDIKKLKVSLLTEIIARSGEILFTVFVILQAMEGRLTVGNTVLYIQLAASVYHSFSEMTLIFVNGYVITTDMMGRLFDFYDRKCPCDSTGIRKLDDFESLTFDHVSFKYPMTESYSFLKTFNSQVFQIIRRKRGGRYDREGKKRFLHRVQEGNRVPFAEEGHRKDYKG